MQPRIRKNVRQEAENSDKPRAAYNQDIIIDVLVWNPQTGEHRMSINANQVESVGEHAYDNRGSPYQSVLTTKTGNTYYIRNTYDDVVAQWRGWSLE